MASPELSLVLPVRNQADHIGGVLQKYLEEFRDRPWEIVLVPNACTDRSPDICREWAAQDGRLRVVENPAGGWGRSVLTGLSAARGEYLGYTNSARTDPSQVTALFGLLQSRPGALAKVRRHSRGRFLREAGSLLYNLECRLLLGVRCRDVNGTPKLFHRSLWEKVRLHSEGDLLDAELLACCARLEVPVLEMPVGGFHRHGGKSSTNWKSAWGMYAGAVKLWREGT